MPSFEIIRRRFIASDAYGNGREEIVAIADSAADVPSGTTDYAAGSVVFVPGGSQYVANTTGTFVEES